MSRADRFIIPHLILLCIAPAAFAQRMNVAKIEPPNWWTGMRLGQVQLMITGDNLGSLSARSQSPQVRVARVYRTPNPSYAFIDIELDPGAFEGFHRLMLYAAKESLAVNYPILHRKNPDGRFRGFDPGDIVYLIMPDRFANGDTTNDSIEGYPDRRDRSSPLARHGGDLAGLMSRLDYLADLGVTTLWLNPLVENNMSQMSYHGYAATDLYRIDPRFGTNAQYEEFVREAHAHGLKVIMDHVSNHIGINHPWIKNLPSADWLNGSVANHQRATHYKIELTDIHADSAFRTSATLGWFADHMPDLNQRNSFVSRYLIQNALWWIESTGLDGIREDTYPYADARFLSDWTRTILAEYPNFNIVGEVWVGDPVFLASYQHGSPLARSSDTNLPTLTDFALYDAFTSVFGTKASIRLIYDCLAKDHLYGDPYSLLTFVDNHDVRRIQHVTGGDTKRTLLALKLLLTTRGIPQIYYGTELGMLGGRDHGTIRGDFPGGFPLDSADAFTTRGRSPRENQIFSTVRQLIHLRKERPSLSSGRLVHYPPANEAYAYFRIFEGEKTLIVVNNKEERQRVSLIPFRNQLIGARTLLDVLTGESLDLKSATELDVGGNDAAILDVR